MTENEKEKLDLLLEQNAGRQLAKIDWRKLNASISSRIDTVSKPATFKWPVLLKIAAVITIISAIAALLLSGQFSLSKKAVPHASVKFPHSIAKTIIQIPETPAQTEVFINPSAANSAIVKCEVEIIEPVVKLNPDLSIPTWVIICKMEPPSVPNGINEKTASLLCLF